MVERHISMRGEVVDFNRLRLRNAEAVALGNGGMNARGDIIGRGGIVIKTQEQVEAEWAARIAEQQEISKSVDIKNPDAVAAAGAPIMSPNKQMQAPPGLAPKMVDASDAGFDPDPSPRPRRKIIESDQ